VSDGLAGVESQKNFNAMTSKLKPDEEFVARSLATHFDGIWSPGENPPDIYLEIGSGAVAVEISILTQHVVDPRQSHWRPSHLIRWIGSKESARCSR
jgi:hypothetical protein